MKSDKKKDNDTGLETLLRPVTGETLLRYEIGFWRELLSIEDSTAPTESVERMRQALALAERRLQDWYADSSGPEGSNDRQRGTSCDRKPSLH